MTSLQQHIITLGPLMWLHVTSMWSHSEMVIKTLCLFLRSSVTSQWDHFVKSQCIQIVKSVSSVRLCIELGDQIILESKTTLFGRLFFSVDRIWIIVLHLVWWPDLITTLYIHICPYYIGCFFPFFFSAVCTVRIRIFLWIEYPYFTRINSS